MQIVDTPINGFLAGRLNVGGVWYARDTDISKIKGLTKDDLEFYHRRGLINTRPLGGMNMRSLVNTKPVEPMRTTEVPLVPETTVPVVPLKDEATDTVEKTDAEKLLQERKDRAANALNAGRGGKHGRG